MSTYLIFVVLSRNPPGFCMTASAYFGIRGMEIVSYVSVPLILVLGTYSMVTATHAGGGLAAVFARSVGGITVFNAIGMVEVLLSAVERRHRILPVLPKVKKPLCLLRLLRF